MKLPRFILVFILGVTVASYLPVTAVNAESTTSQTTETEKSSQKTNQIVKNENVQAGVKTYNDYFPDDNLAKVVSSALGETADTEVTESKLAQLTSLSCIQQGIKDSAGIEYLTGLVYLNMNSNQLKNLDVSSNTALTTLYCSNNQITTLDVSKNTALIKLYCSNNQLTDIALGNNLNLNTLYCPGNELATIDVSGNTGLTTFLCDENKLINIDISKNKVLTYFSVSNNQLENLDVSSNTALSNLYCSYNQLTNIDLNNSTALKFLHCDNNQLTSLDVGNLQSLAMLDCAGNKMKDLSNLIDSNLTSYNAIDQILEDTTQIMNENKLVYAIPKDLLDKSGNLIQTIQPQNGGIYDAATRTITWDNLAVSGDVSYTFTSDDNLFSGTVTVPYAEKEAISISNDNEISYDAGITKTEAEFLADIHATVTPSSETLTSNFADVVDLTTAGDYLVTLKVAGSDVTKQVTVHMKENIAPTINLTSDDKISYMEGDTKTEAAFLADIHASVTPTNQTITSNFTNVVDFKTPGKYLVTLRTTGTNITKQVTVYVTKKPSKDTPITPVPPKKNPGKGNNGKANSDNYPEKKVNSKENGQNANNPALKVTTKELPKTGDSNLFGWTVVGLACIGFGALFLTKRKKKQTN
ncbi:LapB repeat-containing protein [Listeria seeligeri]|uniref:LapB repeat-containing protein n=1 Tax=Listeria seeligeri TaxID=1640 RepID=UPI0016268560|nr:LapB repeat-containing protein [Listeria seeligeri]MBC1577211.1 LapB repeat-containing protein [Listeria seeligeri]MBC1593256.1 LapB repeat-containing protein [Listeria seeligeri]MBC2198033.1 LapB repeat-containing protein [Listeria seeligeri]MBC2212253.1 LapB repeat-containing protein [Listeria seeligeri]MBC2218078.1 LapB repeat-containing protein [Listeria seeligeri]